jgi:hypothetical protein
MSEGGYCGLNRAERLSRGHVYLIAPLSPHKGWNKGKGKWPFKIGVSKSEAGVSNRLKDLSSGNWMKLDIEYISPQISQPYNVEWFLHTRYSKNKLRGEWFDLTFDEVNYIIHLLDKEPDNSNSMASWGYGDDPWLTQNYWAE